MKTTFQLFTILVLTALINNTANAIENEVANELGIETTSQGKCLRNRKAVTQELLTTSAQSELSPSLENDLACLALTKNIKHDKTYTNSILWKDITSQIKPGSKHIRGKLSFSGIVKMPYSYEIKQDSDKRFEVTVRIHVKRWKLWKESELLNISEPERTKHLQRVFDLSLNEAEKYWNNDELGIKFRFVREENIKNADFSITLRQNIRGSMYNVRWDWWPVEKPSLTDDEIRRNFSFITDTEEFAHEIGHMMGLDDEYSVPKATLGFAAGFAEGLLHPKREWNQLQTDKWVRGCDQSSIMCKDWNESFGPSNYHYYLILKRYFEEK